MGGLLGLYRPDNAEAGAQGRHGQLADVVARQLQRALATDAGLRILREGGETVELLKDGQVPLRIGDRLEATEVLVCWSKRPMTGSTVLLVDGIRLASMLLASLGQWRSRKSKMTAA